MTDSRRATFESAPPRRLLAGGAFVAAVLALGATVMAAPPPEEATSICAAGGGALAANADRLTTDLRLFQTSYSRPTWSGEVSAFRVEAGGTVDTTPVWEAAERVPAAAGRKILTSTAATTGVEFKWSDLPLAQQERFGSEEMVDYLRGDPSREQAKGGPYRNRPSRLGAIVNSESSFAGVENFGYQALPGAEGTSYAAFMLEKRTRPQLVFAGANDGMLHAFDAAGGVEKFAFVPRALVEEPISENDPRSTLVRLSDPAFAPRYFVDGASWVGDAYWGGSWKTVLVGTAGAGARSAFAIDVTDPNSVSPGKLLFDLADVDGTSDPNLGHSFGEPVIGRLDDGHFYAIFGNGRASHRQCPVLYLVRLSDGLVRRVPTGGRTLAETCADAPNGLGRPSLYDVHRPGESGHRVTDFAYAGDAQGNVWRFDLRGLDMSVEPPGNEKVQLLFSARNESNQPQPITGAIELGVGPADVAGSPRPVMLWFGTGRYFETADAGDQSVQSMYGIVDRFSLPLNPNTAVVSRGSLQQQTANVSGDLAGTISGNKVDYGAGQNGWFLDLPREGERMTGLPLIQTGRLFFATYVPTVGGCYRSGSSWLYAVDPYNGTRAVLRPFVAEPALDFLPASESDGVVRSLLGVDAGSRAFLFAGGSGSGTSGPGLRREEVRPVQQGSGVGRVSWREIVR